MTRRRKVQQQQEKPRRRYNNIDGPCLASQWTGPAGQTLWMFGDYHSITLDATTHCVPGVTVRLEHALCDAAWRLADRGETLDVLLEDRFSELKNLHLPRPAAEHSTFSAGAPQSYMHTLSTFLWGCYGAPQCPRACYFPNMRLHSVDFREILFDYRDLVPIMHSVSSLVYQALQNNSGQPSPEERKNISRLVSPSFASEDRGKILNAVRSYLERGCVTMRDLMMNNLEREHAIKDINAIANPSLREKVRSVCVTNPLAAPFFDTRLQGAIERLEKDAVSYALFLRDLSNHGDVLLDAYFIARLMKDFKGGSPVKNALGFVGFTHYKTICRDLAKLGFTRKWTSPPMSKSGIPRQWVAMPHILFQ